MQRIVNPKQTRLFDSFDSILSFCLTGQGTLCTFHQQCRDYIVVEHTGDCFCCDFYVEPKYHLGNILNTPIGQLAASDTKRAFARQKQNLPNKCLLCGYLNICRGGCTRHRTGLSRENHFCQAYKTFFDHAMPKFMQLAATLTQ